MNLRTYTIVLITACALLSSTVKAQHGLQYNDTYNELSPLGYSFLGADYLASGKATVAQSGLIGAALVNPAGICSHSVRIDISSSLRLPSSAPQEFESAQVTYLPSLLTVTIPLDELSLQTGIIRCYDEKYSSPDIMVRTIEHPEGTGEYFRSVTEGTVHTLFAGAALTPDTLYSVGLTAGLDFVYIHNALWTSWEDHKGVRVRLVGGVLLRPNPGISLGLSLRYTTSANLEYASNLPSLVGNGLPPRPAYVARSPLEIEIGASLQLIPQIILSISGQYENWTSVISGTRDLWQYRIGTDVALLSSLRLRAGVFSQHSPMRSLEEYYSQQFVTVGGSVEATESIVVSLSYVTSEPFAVQYPVIALSPSGRSFHRTEWTADLSLSF